MPCAQVIAFTDDCLFGNITQTGDAGLKVYLVASSATSTLAMNEYVQGKFVRAITQETAGTIVSYNAASTQVDIDSGMRVLPRMSNYLPDAVYQTSHPVVTVRERAEIVQLNVAPGRYMRPVPTGGVVLGETWNVSLGRFDAQGNRQFVAVWERRVRQRAISDYTTYNSADKSGFAVTQSAAMIDRNGSTAAPAFGDYVAWQPSAVALNPPQSDIISTTAQDVTASVLDPLSTGTPADADAAYRIDRLARKYQRSLS